MTEAKYTEDKVVSNDVYFDHFCDFIDLEDINEFFDLETSDDKTYIFNFLKENNINEKENY